VADVVRVDLQGPLPGDDFIAIQMSFDDDLPGATAPAGNKFKGCWFWLCTLLMTCMATVTSTVTHAVTSTFKFFSPESDVLPTHVGEATGINRYAWVGNITSARRRFRARGPGGASTPGSTAGSPFRPRGAGGWGGIKRGGGTASMGRVMCV
jgi:hypothetical protein